MRKWGVFHVVKLDLTIATSTRTTMITKALATMIQATPIRNNHASNNENNTKLRKWSKP